MYAAKPHVGLLHPISLYRGYCSVPSITLLLILLKKNYEKLKKSFFVCKAYIQIFHLLISTELDSVFCEKNIKSDLITYYAKGINFSQNCEEHGMKSQ